MERVGYQAQVALEDSTTKVAEVEFINNAWHLLDPHDGKYQTNSSGRFRKGLFGVGNWSDSHPNNPKNKDITIDVAPSFGDYLAKGIKMATKQAAEPSTQINMGGGPVLKGKKKETDQKDAGNGGLKGKTPNIFDGDQAKSKAFLSDTKIYFCINRKKTEIKNCYTRVLLTLSFIKGPNVVNWVDTQLNQIEDDLKYQCGDDKFNETLWDDFERHFKCAFVSSTAKEDAYIKMQKLKMKNDQLDEYIAEHRTLISELDWDADSKMSCHSFREGLPEPLARKVINMEGIPDLLTQWVQYAQKYHSRWVMMQALGYVGKKNPATQKPQWNPREKKKERDPDTMDVGFTQMTPDKKEQLMKSGSCFCCKKQEHLSRNCPTRNKVSAQEANMGPQTENPKPTKGKSKKPSPYETLVKQINACSMEDRQKLLEVFSQDGDSREEDF